MRSYQFQRNAAKIKRYAYRMNMYTDVDIHRKITRAIKRANERHKQEQVARNANTLVLVNEEENYWPPRVDNSSKVQTFPPIRVADKSISIWRAKNVSFFFFLIVKNLFAQEIEIEDKFYEMIIRPREIWRKFKTNSSRRFVKKDKRLKISPNYLDPNLKGKHDFSRWYSR